MIKKALRGSISVGLSKGIGTKYDHFIRTFPLSARRVTKSCSEQCQQPNFIHTFYLHDIVAVITRVLSKVVNATAIKLDIGPENVELGRDDRELLVEKLQEIQIPDSVTGRIQFTSTGNRNAFLFDIRNFVPIYNANFSDATAVPENPWVIQRRGTMKKEDENITITFYTSEGNVSNASTIIFADGTSNIPLDRVIHLYIRGWLTLILLHTCTY